MLAEGCEWEEELPAVLVGRLLLQLADHDPRTIAGPITDDLNLPSQKERAEILPPKKADADKEGKLRQHRLINKAMCMELLSASLLTHLDSAEQVKSHSSAQCRRPYYYARSGAPDLVATYAKHPSAKGFRIVGEVSAKRQVHRKFWLRQLKQAVKHAEKLRKDAPNLPVYALVINGGRIGKSKTLQKAYRDFIKERGLRPDGGIRVLPMADIDIAHALSKLDEGVRGAEFWFGSERLAQAFDTMIEMLLQPRPPPDPSWMEQVLINAGTGAQELIPGGTGFRP